MSAQARSECVGCPYADRPAPPIVAFDGRLRVEIDTGFVRWDGHATRVTPQVARVLAALAKQAGAVVSADRLILACSNGSEDGISLSHLGAIIFWSRRALPAQLSLTTYHKVGYRLGWAGDSVDAREKRTSWSRMTRVSA